MNQRTTCPICGTINSPGRTMVPDSLGCERAFCGCIACDHLWVEPLPSAVELEGYYSSRTTMTAGVYAAAYLRKKLNCFRRVLYRHALKAPKVILELGPGPHGLTDLLMPGDHYIAVEPGEAYQAAIANRLKNRGIACDCYASVSDVPKTVKPDLFFSNAAFEHLTHPRDTFLAACHLMAPGSLVIFGVPDRCVELPDAPMVAVGGYKNRSFHPTHLHSFSDKSVLSLFQQAAISRVAKYHALKPALAAAFQEVHDVLNEGIRNSSFTSARWLTRYVGAMIALRFMSCVVDPRRRGDDRCEVIHVGTKE